MADEMSVAPPMADGRRQGMRVPDEVAAMLHLHGLGWGTRRIAAELGCDRETVSATSPRAGGRLTPSFATVPTLTNLAAARLIGSDGWPQARIGELMLWCWADANA